MRALQIEHFGIPSEVLKLIEVDNTPPGPGEVRVRVEAAGVNPSDVGNVNGKFPVTKLPRIVGRDFAGTVVEGRADLIGFRFGVPAEILGSPVKAAMQNSSIFRQLRRPAPLRIYPPKKQHRWGFLF